MCNIDSRKLILRSMREDDVERAVAIAAVSLPQDKLNEQEFWIHLTLPNHFALVAELDSEVVGFMLYEKIKGELYLAYIAVDSTYRGLGAGRTMIVWLQKELSALSRTIIALHVSALNQPALHLYESLGFKRVGSVPGHCPDGTDAIEMVFSQKSNYVRPASLHVG